MNSGTSKPGPRFSMLGIPCSESSPWIISASTWLGAKAILTSLPPPPPASTTVVVPIQAAAAIGALGTGIRDLAMRSRPGIGIHIPKKVPLHVRRVFVARETIR